MVNCHPYNEQKQVLTDSSLDGASSTENEFALCVACPESRKHEHIWAGAQKRATAIRVGFSIFDIYNIYECYGSYLFHKFFSQGIIFIK